jgi:hypothetical protein
MKRGDFIAPIFFLTPEHQINEQRSYLDVFDWFICGLGYGLPVYQDCSAGIRPNLAGGDAGPDCRLHLASLDHVLRTTDALS